MKIAIIGGGIGGLTAALALRQMGFEPEVFEQAPQLLEVGAAIAMWPNAVRVLKKLGIAEQVINRAGFIEQVRWLKCNGALIRQARLPITDVPAVALHRADLQSALLLALPKDSVQLGCAVASYHGQGSQIRARFTSGSAIECDVLIGADGLHSQMRGQALNDGPPVYRGYTVWRGVTDWTPTDLTPATAVEIQGRGKRFGIGPVGVGRVGWWASINQVKKAEKPQQAEQQKLLALFAEWCSPVVELIEATPSATILRNAVFDRPSTNKWGSGRMTLLGDAIHPTTPNLGQGGCLAVEDAAVLARCLAKYADPGEGLRTYERLRFARTAAITRYSRLYGNIGQWESRLGVLSRTLMLQVVPDSLTRRLLKLIFDYDAYGVPLVDR